MPSTSITVHAAGAELPLPGAGARRRAVWSTSSGHRCPAAGQVAASTAVGPQWELLLTSNGGEEFKNETGHVLFPFGVLAFHQISI